jgi:hypothetical protein
LKRPVCSNALILLSSKPDSSDPIYNQP